MRDNGQGLMKYANGDTYDGSWAENLPNGYGRFAWNDGRFYEGEWLLGKRHGYVSTLCCALA